MFRLVSLISGVGAWMPNCSAGGGGGGLEHNTASSSAVAGSAEYIKIGESQRDKVMLYPSNPMALRIGRL